MPRTQIFQLGEDVSVVTDATEERDFLEGFAEAIGGLNNGTPLRPVLEGGFDIICKFFCSRSCWVKSREPGEHECARSGCGARWRGRPGSRHFLAPDDA